MKLDCEHYQMNISAMLDGELSGSELAETVEHLAQCETCRKEMERFRRMQELVDGEYVEEAVPRNVWKNIERISKAEKKPAVIGFKDNVYKIIAAAAVLIIIFGAGYFFGRPGTVLMQDGQSLINLASQPQTQQMNDDRFIDITRELLNSDPRYQVKMYMILHSLFDQNIEGGFVPMRNEDMNESDEGMNETPPEDNQEIRF